MAETEYSVLYRSYGKQHPEDLWPARLPNFENRLFVLTTTDSRLDDLNAQGVEVIPPIYTMKEAGENSATILNQGLEFLAQKGEKEVLLVASGYQSSLSEISRALSRVVRQQPDKDVYFFITPDLHDTGWEQINSPDLDLFDQRRNIYPSESLALVNISAIYPLDEELTKKGNLGYTESGIPLGGIELVLTMLKKYSESNKRWRPSICGIYAPYIKRSPGTFQIADDSFPARYYRFPDPVEYTSKEDKQERREITIDRALAQLGLDKDDYNRMFGQLVFEKFEIT